MKSAVLASKEAKLVLEQARSSLSVQSSGATFDPMANAYQSPDGSKVWIVLSENKDMQLAMDIVNGQATTALLEKITVNGTNGLNEVVDLKNDVKLEIHNRDGKITARTALITSDDLVTVKSLFGRHTLKPQGTMYLDDPGLINPNRIDPCADEYAAMLAANQALGVASQNLQTAGIATGGATSAGAVGGMLLGGPLAGAVGGAIGFIGSAPFYVTAQSQFSDAMRAWQLAALYVRTC